jgi:OOP family OmpA-OmpF porin
MKYLIRICLLVTFLPAFLKAQTAERPFALGLWGGSTQYNGDLGQGFYSSSGQDAHLHIGLSAAWFVTNHFDFAMNTTIGSIGYREDQLNNFEANQFQWNAQMRAHLFKEERFRVNPYGLVGIGISYLSDLKYPGTDIFFPFGAGLKVTLTPKLNLHLQETFAYTDHDNRDKEAGDNFDSFLMHSIGLSWNFAGPADSDKDGVNDKKDKCPDTPAGAKVDNDGCPLDRDGDGIPDFTDVCPDIKGVKSAKGCPDKDGDTVMDSLDKCIDVPGLVSTNPALNGCPDKDGDGIVDAEDRCPEVKGTLALQGCVDTDNDSIIDPDDACPAVPGTIANKGCPEEVEAPPTVMGLDNVYFETSSAKISEGYQAVLDAAAKTLKEKSEIVLEISGHTDSTGPEKFNKSLSKNRANAVKAYLVRKGISSKRLTAVGVSSTQPASDNNTEEGRAKNRRVELRIKK